MRHMLRVHDMLSRLRCPLHKRFRVKDKAPFFRRVWRHVASELEDANGHARELQRLNSSSSSVSDAAAAEDAAPVLAQKRNSSSTATEEGEAACALMPKLEKSSSSSMSAPAATS